jgi:methionyl-tRNA formyltransferase
MVSAMATIDDKIKIALFTSQDIGYQLVEALAKRSDISLLVVTERTKRHDLYGYRSALKVAKELDIPYIQTSRVDEPVRDAIGAFAPDIIVSAYYAHLIPDEVLLLAKRGGINIHPGILPHYRGRFPTPWYILNGANKFGIAIHQIDSGIDTGPVFVQAEYPLDPRISGHDLYRLTMELGAALLLENLDRIVRGDIAPKAQAGGGTFYNSIERRFAIDWNLPAETIERRVRVHARPYFPAHSYIYNCMLLVNRAEILAGNPYAVQAGGTILDVLQDGSLIVSACDGALKLSDFELVPVSSQAERAQMLAVGNRFD